LNIKINKIQKYKYKANSKLFNLINLNNSNKKYVIPISLI